MQILKMQMRYLITLMLFCLSCITHAAEDKKPVGTIISFSAEASQTVSNDLARATVFAEANDANSAAVARKVNGLIAQAMATTKGFPEVKTRSGSTWTSPVYGKSGRNIEAWQMHSELQLESRDIAALGDLIGKLQGSLGVSQINLQPATETRLKAQEQATLGALNAFQTKAKSIASNFKKYYKIVRMNVEGGNQGPIYPMVRSAMVKMEAAPMPIEGGDSTITVTVSGEIELID
jgi:predicted secreted protein